MKETGFRDSPFMEQLLGKQLVLIHRKPVSWRKFVFVFRPECNLQHTVKTLAYIYGLEARAFKTTPAMMAEMRKDEIGFWGQSRA
jgi:hypothetical protein